MVSSPGGAYQRQTKRSPTSNTSDDETETLPLNQQNNGIVNDRARKGGCRLLRQHFPILVCVSAVAVFILIYVGSNVAHQRHLKRTTTPGLWTPLPAPLTQAPAAVRRTVCLTSGQQAMLRAFKTRKWKVLGLGSSGDITKDTDACAGEGTASIIWTKKKFFKLRRFKPWQRYSWINHQNEMSMKSFMLNNLLTHTQSTGQPPQFLPETWILPTHTSQAILDRFSDEGGGLNEPWVIKLAATDNGIGIAILGPNSERLHQFRQILKEGIENNTPVKELMSNVREHMVFTQPHDTRSKAEVKLARERSAAQADDVIIQRYVCNELTYKKHKFDLRIYYLIASVNPLVVYYHDGSLRVALGEYNNTNFTATHDHLTNLGQNRGFQDASAGFEEWDLELKAHVNSPSHSIPFSSEIKNDPLQHVRNQIKAALAELIASVRDRAFRGFSSPPGVTRHGPTETPMENSFALMGADFIVDEGLNVFMTETQSSPGLSDSLPSKKKLNNKLLPNKIAMLEEIMEKQAKHRPIFPMKNEGSYELIYTDDFQYRYSVPQAIQPHRGPCQ
jgi:hypothetical protein